MFCNSKILHLSLLLLTLTTLSSCSRSQSPDETEASAPAAKIATQSTSKKTTQSAVQEIKTVQEFRDILTSGKPVIAKFYASWCGPCQRMKPIFAATADKFSKKAHFVSLNHETKALEPLFAEFNVSGFPTFIYFDKNSKIISSRPGGMDADAFDATVADFIKKQS